MKKVVCCIPLSWSHVPTAFFESMFAMQFYAKDKYDFGMITYSCCYLDVSRDELVEKALGEKPDYILFLDADQTYPADSPEILMKHIDDGKMVVGGITGDRGLGDLLVYNLGSHNIAIRNREIMAQTGVHKVEAMGMGGIMIHPKVFDIIEHPRFQSGWDWKACNYVGEDIRFYANCKKHEIDVWCDTDVLYGHLVTRPMYPS